MGRLVPASQPLFIPSVLLSVNFHKEAKHPTKPLSAISQINICNAWSLYEDFSNSSCPKQHVCIICKHSDHCALACSKRKFPVHTRRPHSTRHDWLATALHQRFPEIHLSFNSRTSPASCETSCHLYANCCNMHTRMQSILVLMLWPQEFPSPLPYYYYFWTLWQADKQTCCLKGKHLFLLCTYGMACSWNCWKPGGTKCWFHCVDYNCCGVKRFFLPSFLI